MIGKIALAVVAGMASLFIITGFSGTSFGVEGGIGVAFLFIVGLTAPAWLAE